MRSRCDYCRTRQKLSEVTQADSQLNAAYRTTVCDDTRCRDQANEMLQLTRHSDSTGNPPDLVMTGHDTTWPWKL